MPTTGCGKVGVRKLNFVQRLVIKLFYRKQQHRICITLIWQKSVWIFGGEGGVT